MDDSNNEKKRRSEEEATRKIFSVSNDEARKKAISYLAPMTSEQCHELLLDM